MPFDPTHLILHDYGKLPADTGAGMHNPYHVLVMPDGSVRYRYPDAPYGQAAPHAFMMNPRSLGLAYGGAVGSAPTPEAMEAIRAEYQKIKSQFPNIETLGHGEAFHRGPELGLERASRDGRDLVEASWRAQLLNQNPMPMTVAAAPATQPESASGQSAPTMPMVPQASISPPGDSVGGNSPSQTAMSPEEQQKIMSMLGGSQKQQADPQDRLASDMLASLGADAPQNILSMVPRRMAQRMSFGRGRA